MPRRCVRTDEEFLNEREWAKVESREVVGGNLDWDVESLVEQIWTDLGGQVSRLAIRHKVADVIPAFQDARITAYVPIFVRRRTVEQLRAGFSEITPQSAQEPTWLQR